ncbi:SiaB family protein kinase [Azonexus hydrophilus]|jgi:hypothetical protein|uniref:SiaB family protein kinase n=1 Tax=Azonexus hydrophilus TaxID=418702 RepID=A0ABZ2XFP6_9RHOO|nr:SiaB family protein kinase [Azonexus hydrophilus]MBS4018884.1 SiaB family protein kinase [Dechloromonas sp.]
MNTLHLAKDFSASFELACQQRVIFYYVGYFSQNVVAAMADAVRLQLEMSGVNSSTRRKLFSSFVEMAQNIIHYSADSLTPSDQDNHEMRHGSVCICEKEGQYLLQCANPIDAAAAEGLRERLQSLRSMTLEEIKQACRASLRAETPEGSKGAGLGFLTVARDSSEPLEFDFQPLEAHPGTVMFNLKATV